MLRRVLLFSAALAGTLGSTDASIARTTIPVRGDVKAVAFSGDALIVARQPRNRGLALERIAPGARAQTLLRLPPTGGDTEVALAASPQAIAFSVQTAPAAGFSASHVFVGPAAGPLREVAACTAGVLLPPVAVAGSSIAWREGGCGEPTSGPRRIGPVSIMIGGPNPAVMPRRVAVGPNALPASIVLNGESGFAGMVSPSFFAVSSEVRRFGADALGETIAAEDGRVVAPVGVLSSGNGVFVIGPLDETDAGYGAGCETTLFEFASGSSQRRAMSLGGCLIDSGIASPATRVAGDRVYSLVAEPRKAKGNAPPAVAFVGARSGGGDVRVVVRGTYRPPRGIAAADSGRVAWWQRRCAGDAEIVTDGALPATATTTPSCNLRVLDRTARVRGGRVKLRLRCPSGCSGQVIGDSRRPRLLGSFSFRRGKHSLRLRLTRKERRSKRLRLAFEVLDGRSRSTVIRLR